MWLTARTQPPVAGMLSPPCHRRLVNTSSRGSSTATQKANAHPLGSCSLRALATDPSSRPRRPAATPGEATCAQHAACEVPVGGPGRSRACGPGRIGPMTATSSSAPGFAVLVPVKRTAVAKSRLGGLGDAVRRDLASAFAADTVAAALACEQVASVLAVTDDHELAGGLRDLGADVIPDGTSDLNGTLLQAAAEVHRRDPGLALVALCADLPALRPDDVSRALAAADTSRMSFVADRQEVGTTAVVAPSLETFRPAFGDGSRRQHIEAGAFEITDLDLPTLRRDVDEPADLAEALRLGVGPRTLLVATAHRL